MEESINMAVRCPCCDSLLFETDNTNMRYRCGVCHKNLMITVHNSQMLITIENTGTEADYSNLVKRQIGYVTKVSRAIKRR